MATDFISTPLVKKFNFLEPAQEDILISDIAHSLSLACRFGGHCSTFYSVAEHSIILAEIVENTGASQLTIMAGLLHDAEEAYLPDIPRPIKALMPEARAIYEVLQDAIAVKFHLDNLDEDEWKLIEDIDRRLCITEAKALGVWNKDWEDAGAPLKAELHLWSSTDAEALFLENFILLGEKLYDYVLR